ncbi:GAF domain-containing protein [Novosphingobium sp. KACC 22771]|uniref:GAF domain-containing protein n=1 Tax=Novosphingobium sp. KACC 22771 TaxID=3025670 RepID=UPI002365B837|nr:GAF domain-containing protein [Novosphingobium sp. KACC 22771]WDF72696.1 GAF domain-containing protein [Novosphingobium sp. KACC 22771]
MFDFAPGADAPKSEIYHDLREAALAITSGESDGVANMANIAALIWQFLPDLNWAGFYRTVGDELVLGPFVGKPACIRIPFGRGVCGTAAASAATQLVADVHAFPGHIACDGASASELVVPVVVDGRVVAVIDLDSPIKARFDQEDAAGIEALAAAIASAVAGALTA